MSAEEETHSESGRSRFTTSQTIASVYMMFATKHEYMKYGPDEPDEDAKDGKDGAVEWKSQHANDGLPRYGGSRDVVGYASIPPRPKFPKGGKVALNFVVNLEGGGEPCTLHGDNADEGDERDVAVETQYDYGPRSGFWRLHRLFTSKKVPVTVFAVGMALERNPAIAQALKETPDWEVASKGYRGGINYQEIDVETEFEHMKRAIEIHKKVLGKRPVGFFQGMPSPNTRRLVVEEGGFKYDSDSYADDLPYWTLEFTQQPHLIIPSSLAESDTRFVEYSTSDKFCDHLKETLRFLIEEGRAGSPKLMTVDLHCMLSRPSRVAGLLEFVEYAKGFGNQVWFCTREQLADFWIEFHSPRGAGKSMIDLTAL